MLRAVTVRAHGRARGLALREDAAVREATNHRAAPAAPLVSARQNRSWLAVWESRRQPADPAALRRTPLIRRFYCLRHDLSEYSNRDGPTISFTPLRIG